MEAGVRVRKSAEQRRTEIVEIALRHFATSGFAGTSTEAIAAEAGISQPYLFRLFKTKRELFVACTRSCNERVLGMFRDAAAAAPPEQRLEAMGEAYMQRLLPDRTMLLFQLQSYTAAWDPEIQAAVREGYGRLITEVQALSDATSEQLWDFFGSGMLLNVVAALGMPPIKGTEDWAKLWDCAPPQGP
jgi:AcrR family transcriptional regulator